MKKRRLNKHGASLAETLVTVLLLVIVLAAVTTGVHAMTTSYYQIRRKANAESLLMTASDVIRGDLRNSTAVYPDDDSESSETDASPLPDRYYCQSRYSVIGFANGDSVEGHKKEDGIQVLYYDEDTGKTTPKPLVTSATNTNELYTYITSPFTYTDATGTITGKIEVCDKSGKSQTGSVEITVRPFHFKTDDFGTPSPAPSATPGN